MRKVFLVQDKSILKNSVLDVVKHKLEKLIVTEQQIYVISIISDLKNVDVKRDIFLFEPSLRSKLTTFIQDEPTVKAACIDLKGYGLLDEKIILAQIVHLDKYGSPKGGKMISRHLNMPYQFPQAI